MSLKNGILVCVSVLIGLVAAELIVRVFGLAPQLEYIQKGRFRLSPNPRIGYELTPDFYGDDDGAFWDFLGTTNSLGFRDREHARYAPRGTQRVIVLGDSITQGKEIKDREDIFTGVIERSLRTRGYQVEVFNFGVSGYNTRQEIETLIAKGLDVNPRIVVLQYCLNDRDRDTSSILSRLLQLAEKEDKWDRRFLPYLFGRSALYRLVRYRLTGLRFEFGQDQKEAYHYKYDDDTVSDYFCLLRRLADRHHFDVVVALFPLLEDLDQYAHLEEHQLVRDWAASNRFQFIDLLPVLRACRADGPVAYDPLHPNERGHACAGRAIAEIIESDILRPADAGKH